MRLTRSTRAVAVIIVAAAATATISAQGPQSAQAQTQWELEFHGGAATAKRPHGGTTTLPPPGPPILTSSPTFPSRETSTWFVGDGTTLVNDVAEEFGLATRLSPLERALDAIGAGTETGAGIGARVRRAWKPRLLAEVSVDLLTGSSALNDEFAAAVESSRGTFESTFTALFSTAPLAAVSTTATAALADGSRRELAVTGTIHYLFGRHGGFEPYVGFGGGVITGAGDGATATVEGGYRFTLPGGAPISETDRATLRLTSRTAPVGVLSAGLRHDLSPAWGFQIDGRVWLGPATTRVALDSAPAATIATPAGFIESFTYPSVQFSNNGSTGRRSTLSGAALQNFDVFTGSGLETRVVITGGVFRRF
jgi:hypothetical protein